MRYANKLIVFVCLFCCSLSCFAQQNEEKQLRKLFRALEIARKHPDVSPVNDVPFYKLGAMETSTGALAGKYCYDIYSSNQLHEMENIFHIYRTDSDNTVYALLSDNTQERLRDFIYVRCGSPHFRTDTSINEIYLSYIQWWDTVKQRGLQYVREAGISPTEYCRFSWHAILGYVSTKTISHKKHKQNLIFDSASLISYSELKKYIFSLLDDEEQVSLFVKQQGLRKRYPDYSDKQIVCELGILSLLNTEELMTDLFFFKLMPLSNEGFNIDLILNELKDTQHYNELKSILEKHQISVVLK
jgi:hypothetical protein